MRGVAKQTYVTSMAAILATGNFCNEVSSTAKEARSNEVRRVTGWWGESEEGNSGMRMMGLRVE